MGNSRGRPQKHVKKQIGHKDADNCEHFRENRKSEQHSRYLRSESYVNCQKVRRIYLMKSHTYK